MTAVAVINGRFLTMQLTGVQRYSHELLRRLPDHVDGDVLVAVPPNQLIDARDRHQIDGVQSSSQWHGPRGHGWEQVVLPRLVTRAGGAPLLSPASWGPVAVGRQIVIVHDVLPRTHGHYFQPLYRGLSRTLLPLLVRRCQRLATPSLRVRDELVRWYRADARRIDVLPPGVGPPFTGGPDVDTGRPYCVMVGAHDRRKNVGFVLEWWDRVHRELGLELAVITRGSATARFGDEHRTVSGVRYVVDPTDDEVAALYRGALCLLWPSIAEGFGLPLLEAMAGGTPFISADTGAARELAVDPDQIQPLAAERWIAQLRKWSAVPPLPVREALIGAAKRFSWDATADAAVRSLHLLAG